MKLTKQLSTARSALADIRRRRETIRGRLDEAQRRLQELSAEHAAAIERAAAAPPSDRELAAVGKLRTEIEIIEAQLPLIKQELVQTDAELADCLARFSAAFRAWAQSVVDQFVRDEFLPIVQSFAGVDMRLRALLDALGIERPLARISIFDPRKEGIEPTPLYSSASPVAGSMGVGVEETWRADPVAVRLHDEYLTVRREFEQAAADVENARQRRRQAMAAEYRESRAAPVEA